MVMQKTTFQWQLLTPYTHTQRNSLSSTDDFIENQFILVHSMKKPQTVRQFYQNSTRMKSGHLSNNEINRTKIMHSYFKRVTSYFHDKMIHLNHINLHCSRNNHKSLKWSPFCFESAALRNSNITKHVGKSGNMNHVVKEPLWNVKIRFNVNFWFVLPKIWFISYVTHSDFNRMSDIMILKTKVSTCWAYCWAFPMDLLKWHIYRFIYNSGSNKYVTQKLQCH